jgi:hypothetical protein
VKLRTPSPQLPTNDEPWQSQTPKNLAEFGSQSTLIRGKYKRELGSSPNSTTSALDHLIKGATGKAHEITLLKQERAELRAALAAATERRSRKRKQIQVGGTLTVEEDQRLTTLKEFSARSDGKKPKKRSLSNIRARYSPNRRRVRRSGA